MKQWNIEHRVEEFVLLALILLNVFDFMELLPHDIDFMKKIISWTILGYLLYRISLTRLFFGERHRFLDISLLLSYFILMAKEVTALASAVTAEVSEEILRENVSWLLKAGSEGLFMNLYFIVERYSQMINIYSFYIAGIAIMVLAVYFAFRYEVKEPSLMAVLHEKGVPEKISKKLERLAVTFLILSGFFILFFNLMMEWLALAVDASLLVFMAIFYLLTMFRRHRKRLDVDSMLYRIGDGAEEFYSDFIGLFHSKKRVWLGFSGLLVLHLLTDIGVFVVPYLLSFEGNILYFGALGEVARQSIPYLFMQDLSSYAGIMQKAGVSLLYFLNVSALVLLLAAPGYIWYKVYRREGFRVSKMMTAVFFSSVAAFILAPAFVVKGIAGRGVLGIDITTQMLALRFPLLIVAALTILIFAAVYILSQLHMIREFFLVAGILVILAFFAYYIYNYFISLMVYYMMSIRYLAGSGYFLIVFYFVVFMLISSIFYFGSFIIFLTETKKEYRYIR